MAVPRSNFESTIRSVIRKIVVLVLGILVSLVVLEASLRGVAAVCSFMEWGDNADGRKFWPFEPWALSRANQYDPICYFYPQNGFFRRPKGVTTYPPLKKEEHTIRIICIGDSATYGAAVDYYHSWVYLLEKKLSKQYPGKRIEVLNAGIPGAISKQIKRVFQFHIVEYKPDILIWRVDSDLTDTYLVDTAPNFVRSFLCRYLYESRVFRVFCALADLWDIKRGKDRKVAGKIYDFMTDRVHRLLKPPIDGFDSDFSMVEKIAKDHGTKYALQVEYLIRNPKSGGLWSFTKTDGNKAVVKMMDAFRENDIKNPFSESGKQINRRSKLPDTLFVDDCHLTEKGEAITAEEICKFIVQNEWIETLP